MKYIKSFSELRLSDVPLVGGKNASLGQMIADLQQAGVTIPDGFAITAEAYWYVLQENKLIEPIKQQLDTLEVKNLESLKKVGSAIRELIAHATFPDDLTQEIIRAYHALSQTYGVAECDVAVRSSATAEDLPTASFAGQQETFLNVQGDDELIDACKKSMASLFTNRAIAYRVEHGFDHMKVALSVGVQKMVRADKGSAGVAFSLDTETGFKDVVVIDSSFGLGESIVKGLVTPDEFTIFTTTLKLGYCPIIQKKIGEKAVKIVYSSKGTHEVPVPEQEQRQFSITDDEVISLARMVTAIEDHYSQLKNKWSPMDVEWARDGVDGKLYILQARPETVHALKKGALLKSYQLKESQEKLNKKIIVSGQSIGRQIVTGKARIVNSINDINNVSADDILITEMTDPDWVPIMKQVAGIITNLGGRTCHAAIVSRELGIPALVGAHDATTRIKPGQTITLDCTRAQGQVYDGTVDFAVQEVDIKGMLKPPVPLLVNCAEPSNAFQLSFLPVDGVGLARTEFIFSNSIKVHPMALLEPNKVTDPEVRKKITAITAGYASGKQYFIEKLSEGIGMIAAAFFPRQVIVRMSDFKSNEYRNLIGGSFFEPTEANPMLGFRGASRYYHEHYAPAFALECEAFKRARDTMGLNNIKIMIPFVRTVAEAQQVINLLKQHGLEQGKDGLELVMMVEIPSNVLLIDEFSKLFDGFSIGSNDLTQLVLGVDRDSALLAEQFDERDPAVKKMLAMAIQGAHQHNRFIGICGQAPSDYPELARFLIEQHIDSLSLNADAVIPFIMRG